jgi:hypothetical protein
MSTADVFLDIDKAFDKNGTLISTIRIQERIRLLSRFYSITAFVVASFIYYLRFGINEMVLPHTLP